MSWASKLVEREIKKRGVKGVLIWVMGMVAKLHHLRKMMRWLKK